MELNIKSNRNFLVKLFAVFDVLFALLFAATLVAYLVEKGADYVSVKSYLWVVITSLSCAVLLTVAILVAKFYSGMHYVFKKDKILAYNREAPIDVISLTDVQTAYYKSFKLKYIITIFFGDMSDGGAWKLHVFLKNGEKKELGFFDKKDAEKIRAFYDNLIEIR